MAVAGMNHFTILTDDLEKTLAFYAEHLGLKPGARPRDLMDLLVRQGLPVEHFEVMRTPVEEIFVRTVEAGDAAAGGAGAGGDATGGVADLGSRA